MKNRLSQTTILFSLWKKLKTTKYLVKWNAKLLSSYFTQRSGERGEGRSRKSTVEEACQGLDSFE
jgi:hypothetical protein